MNAAKGATAGAGEDKRGLMEWLAGLMGPTSDDVASLSKGLRSVHGALDRTQKGLHLTLAESQATIRRLDEVDARAEYTSRRVDQVASRVSDLATEASVAFAKVDNFDHRFNSFLDGMEENLTRAQERLNRREQALAVADRAKAAPKAAAAPVGAATHRMLDEIGGMVEDDISATIQASYGTLTQPMALQGHNDAAKVRAALDADWPWAKALNEAATEALALGGALGKTWMWAPPILLVGPPGVGKTRWARRFAEAGGVPYRCIPVAANFDPFIIAGQSRSWRNSQPGAIAQFIARTSCPNPVIAIDEVDKAGRSSEHGSVQDALLPILERSSAMSYFDYFLLGNLDYRHVTFVLTANDINLLPEPLVDRCRIFEMPSPRPADFEHLLETALNDIARQWEVTPEALRKIALPGESVASIEREFRKDLSIRRLVDRIQAALSRAAVGKLYDAAFDREARGGKQPIGF